MINHTSHLYVPSSVLQRLPAPVKLARAEKLMSDIDELLSHPLNVRGVFTPSYVDEVMEDRGHLDRYRSVLCHKINDLKAEVKVKAAM